MLVRNKRKSLSRRSFLKGIGAGLVVASLGGVVPLDTIPIPEKISIPPSLMFHARYRHESLLPELLVELAALGYEGVTYTQFLNALRGEVTLPEKPILISIDDLSMARGVPAFTTFVRMANTLIEHNFRGVFGINTMPQESQDDDRWKVVSGWLDHGIELATHTGQHTDLSRFDLRAEDYEAEIVESAKEIRERTGQPVSTLILPFGNGYSVETDEIEEQISSSCIEAGIQVLVGILGGRGALTLRSSTDSSPFVMGRTLPGIQGKESVDSALWEVNHWT